MNEETIYTLRNSDSLYIGDTTNIRWLGLQDHDIYNCHLVLCGQKTILTAEEWKHLIIDEGTEYCCLFIDGKPIARTGVERYSDIAWEAADVRVVNEYRGNGYAKQIVSFVTRFILDEGKIATCRTTEDNIAMQKVILSLGYKEEN